MRILAAIMIFLFAMPAMPAADAAPTAHLIAKKEIQSAIYHPTCGQADIVKTANRATRTVTNAFDFLTDKFYSADPFVEDHNIHGIVGKVYIAAHRFCRISIPAMYKGNAIHSGSYIRRLPGRSPPHVIA